ncbi:hypothetical protein WR25_18374 [Diploscapter pachys]|uniref:[Histone H3]-trimethyl-L-lysine(9) demethylase n=1 Tax=Diploscapter pachys TaxID=2018661 RepID=A0A2A2JZ84_9BILA|nr:hypothetical protein WR25_18374 [Diploscapter pachys]
MIEPISTTSPFLPLSETDAATMPCSSSVLPLSSSSPAVIPPIPLCSSSRFTLTIDSSSPSTVDSQGSGPLKLSLGDKGQSCESTATKSSGSSTRRKGQFDSHIPADECIRYSDGTTEKYASAQHPVHTPTGTVPILVYYPTMKQIRDFNYLIELIERTGAHRLCGIVKVVPPPEWSPRGQLKSDFRDANDYLLENPVVEKFEGERETFTRVLSVYSDQMKAKDYRKLATSAKFRPLPAALEMSDPVEIEKEFFANILDREAIYGADTEGSLYAKNVKEINMNCLGTILDETKSDGRIKGVNTVFLYFGMYKAMFPWHIEDMDLYSINYLLHGAPKYWFAIAPESAERFERIMASTFPNEFKHCKAFLRHKFAVATPEFLKKYDIKYGTMMHRENEIILTFPRGYHMGFNMGFNIAESTNFASDRWIDYGKTALLCQCRKDTVQIDMKKFMYKYRPDEAERWMSYWYGNEKVRSAEQPPIKPIFSPFVTVYPYKKIYPITDNDDDEGLSPAKKSKFESNRTSGSTNPYVYVMEHFNSKLLRLQSLRKNFRLKLPGIALDGCSHCAAPAPDIDSKSLRTSVFRKNHGLWARSPFSLKEEHDHNAETAKIAPHCAVCQCFVAPGVRKIVDEIPDKSSVVIRRKSTFTKEDPSLAEDDEMPAQSGLWVCSNCSMTVHACCYGIDEQNADENARSKWRCDRCSERNDHLIRSTSCNLCERRGGALIRAENGQDNETFVHIVCVILNRQVIHLFARFKEEAMSIPGAL